MILGNRNEERINERKTQVFGFALCVLLLALSSDTEAQPNAKLPRVGYLGSTSSSSNAARNQAFQRGLRDLGYIEGKNILLEYRYADGQIERLPELATEFVRMKVDAIVAAGLPAARAAQNATATIPIIMTGGDPVRAGLVSSLARPGGNVTGVSDPTVDVSTKRLQLLQEVVPKIFRISMLWNPANQTNSFQLKDTQDASQVLGITIHPVQAKAVDDIENAFAAIKREGSGALLISGDPLFVAHQARLAELTTKHRLPAMFTARDYVDAGGLISYGENPLDRHRRLATYVDKILKGVKPSELPVEAATRFEMTINMKAAKQIGLTIPPNVLARADRVVR